MLKKTLLSAALLVAAALPIWAEDPAKAPPPPPMTEEQAIAALAPDQPWAQKEVAVRRLRQIGTPKSVPALAAMLTDDKLSHLARYALENMNTAQAGEALRKAAADAKGASKAGAIISLGARKDAAAVDVVAAALKDENEDVVRAAAGALGRIGTPKAADALLDAANIAAEAMRPALGEGLLAATEALTAAGKNADAVKICEALQDQKWPEQVRFGAYRGLVAAQRNKADEQLIATLGGDDAKLRDYAAFLVATAPKLSSTSALAEALPKLPPAGQAALLSGFGGRKDEKARPAASAALDSKDAAVRAAAARALGSFGIAEHVPRLAALLATDAAVSDAAKNALTAMTAKGVDEALAEAAPKAEPAAKALLLAILSDRMAPQTNGIAVAALGDANADVRVAALGALAKLGAKDEVPAVIDAIKKAPVNDERTAGANALNAIAGVQKDEVLAPITAALSGASVEVRGVLLGALVRIGSANALQAFLGELADPKKEGRDEAVRLFTQWPTRDAAAPMLDMAKNDEAHRADLLRGYVRLATGEPDANAKTQMLTAAMDLAKRPEEKWIVLPGWGSLATAQSLELLNKLLDEKDVHNEAGLALITAAKSYAGQGEDQKKAAIESLKAVVAKTDTDIIKNRAKEVAKGLGVDLDAAPEAKK